MKNYRINLTDGCVDLDNGKKKTIYITNKGAFFKLGLKRVYLMAE